MSDQFENKLFQMAAREKMLLPEDLERRVNKLLEDLPERAGKRGHIMNFRRSLILAASFIMLFSITAVAASSLLQQRMESMNRERLEEYFVQIQSSKMPADTYNRSMTEGEKDRLDALNVKYESEGLFPEGEIILIEEASEYNGKQVAFLAETSTFFFPEKEMSDEQLLQIIDFRHKRDYSLMKVNEMIESGEMTEPELPAEEEPLATDREVLLSSAVYEPEQELTIPYTGDLSITAMGSGPDGIFLGGWGSIHKMAIGSSDSEVFFDDFNPDTLITALYQDQKGTVYVAAVEYLSDDKLSPVLWIIDREGTLLNRIGLSGFLKREGSACVNRLAVDNDGNIYLRGLNESSESYENGELLTVIDREGNLVSVIKSDSCRTHSAGGIGIGKDGRAYTLVYIYDAERGERERMGIAAMDPKSGTLTDIYMGIVPEGTIMIDLIAPGAETDFVLWGYDGIFTYNLGEESAVNVLPAYEAPCQWEGVRFCALPDGRVVFADCGEYTQETLENGENRYHAVPEKTCFYYKAALPK